jgi:hypothetical protein
MIGVFFVLYIYIYIYIYIYDVDILKFLNELFEEEKKKNSTATTGHANNYQHQNKNFVLPLGQ